ncbi:alpha/beta hydrolase [Streptomyces sp. CA-250714]|uniref:alpha/beta hydrolase n=1 Tax=Streptomyces sp. CA-250714 TaxID=3240060 RepID=UPI003D89DED8
MLTFEVDPAALFEERHRQFVSWGIPARTVERARNEITDMWGGHRGSWTTVWGRLAEEAEAEGRLLRAAHLWGAARFPVLAAPERLAAYERQRVCYLKAAARFPIRFERRTLDLPLNDGPLPLPVHLMARRGRRRPGVVVISGGVDTWKVELHRMAVATALATGLLVMVIDMPGTGECPLPLTADSDRVLAALVALIRRQRPGEPVAYLGVSFGGHWAVKLAMQGVVDAAVSLGAPTGAAGETDVLALPYGMPGIIANALHLEAEPDAATAADLFTRFSLRDQGLLDTPGGAPLLAVNGDEDQYIPRGDTTALASRPGTTVWLVRGATHCAVERVRPVLLGVWGWLLPRLGAAPAGAETLLALPLRRHVSVRSG